MKPPRCLCSPSCREGAFSETAHNGWHPPSGSSSPYRLPSRSSPGGGSSRRLDWCGGRFPVPLGSFLARRWFLRWRTIFRTWRSRWYHPPWRHSFYVFFRYLRYRSGRGGFPASTTRHSKSGNRGRPEGMRKRMMKRVVDIEVTAPGSVTEEIVLLCSVTGFGHGFLVR